MQDRPVLGASRSPVFTEFTARAATEYAQLSYSGPFKQFVADIEQRWATQDHFSDAQLNGIAVPCG